MHPSLAHRYGLRSAEDIAIAERMIAAAKKAGWTGEQVDGFLQFYGTIAPALETGQLTSDQALHQLWNFAELQSVGEDKRAALLDWHIATGAYMEKHGGGLPPLEKPSAADAAAELAEIEKIQREDPERYWRDEALQSRMHDLIELSRGAGAPPAVATAAHVSRLAELEGMMGDHHSAYWSGAQAEALQAEYRNILSLAPPAAPGEGQSSAGGAATSGGETGNGASK